MSNKVKSDASMTLPQQKAAFAKVKTPASEQMVIHIRASFILSPNQSIGKASTDLGISQRTYGDPFERCFNFRSPLQTK
jgi:hypothetical protein